MLRCLLLSVAIAACGGDAEPELVPGSPEATRALAFDADGAPVAIGGTSTFGLAQLQRFDGDRWVTAAQVSGFGARAQLLGGGPLPLYAIADTTLYRLDDASSFAWSAFSIPLGVSDGTLFGVDAMGAVYGLDLSEGDGNGAVVAWTPGEVRWAEVAGTRPMGTSTAGYVVEPSGRVTWMVPELGIVRAEAGEQTTIVDCHGADFADCTSPITELTYDALGNLTFLVCPVEQPPRVAMRLRDGATTVQSAAIPSSDASCHGLTTGPDGASVLSTLDASGETGTLSMWSAKGTEWNRVASSSRALTYVVRDDATVFGFGDAQGERGIYRIDL